MRVHTKLLVGLMLMMGVTSAVGQQQSGKQGISFPHRPELPELQGRPTNRSASALGLAPHQIERYMARQQEKEFRLADPLRYIQTVPYPTALERELPDNENVKQFFRVCKETTKTVWDAIREEKPLSVADARLYDDLCLGKLSELPSSDIRKWIEKRLVLIGVKQDGYNAWPHCTGLALSAEYIVTAQHCFYNIVNKLIPWQQLEIYQISNPGTSFQLASPPIGTDRAKLAETSSSGKAPSTGDIAYAKLATLINLENTARVLIRSIPLHEGERKVDVLVPGLSGIVATALGENPSPRMAVKFIRIDKSGGCFVERVGSSSCYVHSCQTSAGTSGAPILEFAGSGANLEVTLVAVHSGARDQSSDCPLPGQMGENLNSAAPNLANFPLGTLVEDLHLIAKTKGDR